MEADVVVVPAERDFGEFLRQTEQAGGMKHMVVTRGERIAGVVRVNTALRPGLEAAYRRVTLDTVAQRNFTIARPGDIVFEVVSRLARHSATMAVVTKGEGPPRGW